jgi:hypothetical protein
MLTKIVDHRQRSLAFMATRDAVVVRHFRCLSSGGVVAPVPESAG